MNSFDYLLRKLRCKSTSVVFPLPAHQPSLAPYLNIIMSGRIENYESIFEGISNISLYSGCCDCGVSLADWVSLGFGITICLVCAGDHRALGVHITLVKSLCLDNWTKEQLKVMETGGNKSFLSYLDTIEVRNLDIKAKYRHPRVLYYRCVSIAKEFICLIYN